MPFLKSDEEVNTANGSRTLYSPGYRRLLPGLAALFSVFVRLRLVVLHVVVADLFIFGTRSCLRNIRFRLLAEKGVEEDSFQVLVFGINPLRGPNQGVPNIRCMNPKQVVVHVKAEMIPQQYCKSDNCSGISFPEGVDLPDCRENTGA